MAVFQTTRSNGDTFNLRPFPSKARPGKGWFISAYHATNYGGHNVSVVGWADSVPGGVIAFRLKRDAVAAINEGLALGILHQDAASAESWANWESDAAVLG